MRHAVRPVHTIYVLLLVALAHLVGCGDDAAPVQATAKDVTAFGFLTADNPGLTSNAVGTLNGSQIAVSLPAGSTVTSLVATFEATGSKVSVEGTEQVSGTTANNFTSPVAYIVTAEDGSTKSFTVTVTVASMAAADITGFAFQDSTNAALTADVAGTISGTAIAVTVPTGTEVNALVATFATTGASVTVGGTTQVSGVTANDFTSPVTYVVTAADSTTKSYTVTVTRAASSAKDITSFAFLDAPNAALTADVTGTITTTAIAVTVPFGTNVTALVATFGTSGSSVTVGGTAQVTGVTANNFTSPVTYLVTAGDTTTKSYTVTVTAAANSAKDLTSFAFLDVPNAALTADVTGTITTTAIAVTVPFGTNVTALVATFATTGASVTVGGAPQVTGVTANNFTSPVTYLVTAGDTTTKSYIVTVTVAPNSAKDLTSFAFLDAPNAALSADVTGTITTNAIAVTVPAGTNVTALVATFATTGASVTVGGTPQATGVTANNFTSPVTYLVTAGDTTTKSYTVTVTVAASSTKDITAFAFLDATNTALTADVTGAVASSSIALTVPFGTNVTALVATFTSTGATVTIGGTNQVNGVTANNFTSPVTYRVTAGDTTIKDYTVTVTIAPSPAKDITSFAFLDVPNAALTADATGTIGGLAIAVTVPAGTNVTALVASFTITGVSVAVGATTQVTGVTANNFTSPVTYVVTGSDGLTKTYTVTVTVASSATIADGTYTWGIWTCGNGSTTVDIKAFAMGIGIMEVRNRITGTTGFVDVIHTPTCTRTTAIANITYPSPGMVSYTSASSYTCSVGCAPATCTSNTQAVITDTYSIANNGAIGFTLTRLLAAANVSGNLQAFAGCQVGYTETATEIKL